VSARLSDAVTTYTQRAVSDTLQSNVEFNGEAGLKPKIIRTPTGKCCEWCAKLIGTYTYPVENDDVYRRHDNCRCQVLYDPGDGKLENVHTGEWVQDEEALNERIKKDLVSRNIEKIKGNDILEVGGNGVNASTGFKGNRVLRSKIIKEASEAEHPVYAADLRRVSKNIKKQEGLYDVVIHGSSYYVEYEKKYLFGADTLAMIINGRKDWQGDNIRLLSCSTGKRGKDGNCLAQQLSNILKVDVCAPKDDLHISLSGRMTVGRERLSLEEGMERFTPK
jgi:hypothetical protein